MNKEERALERIAKHNSTERHIYISDTIFRHQVIAENVTFIHCEFHEGLEAKLCCFIKCYTTSYYRCYINAIIRNSRIYNSSFSLCNVEFHGVCIHNSCFSQCYFDDTSDPDLLMCTYDTDFQGCTNMDIFHQHTLIPSEGSFIGYKKLKNEKIAKLLIPEDAKRSCTLGDRKCRADHVIVLDIFDVDDNGNIGTHYDSGESIWKEGFYYNVGQTVYSQHPPCDIFNVGDFDENRWHQCAPGIHFFLDIWDAINY